MKKINMLLFCLHLGLCQPPNLERARPPPPCMEITCTDVPGYPTAEVTRAMNRSPYYRKLLGPNGISPMRIVPQPATGEGSIIGTVSDARKSSDRGTFSLRSNFEQACEVTPVVTEYPKTAMNTRNVTRYIVNTAEYRQPVSTEKCRNENGSCNNLSKFLIPGVTTACRSNYVTLTLVCYDEVSKTLGTDKFSFPTACVCYFKTNN